MYNLHVISIEKYYIKKCGLFLKHPHFKDKNVKLEAMYVNLEEHIIDMPTRILYDTLAK